MNDFARFCNTYIYIIDLYLNKEKLSRDDRDDLKQELVLYLHTVMLDVNSSKPSNEGAFINRAISNQIGKILSKKRKRENSCDSLDIKHSDEESTTMLDRMISDTSTPVMDFEYHELLTNIKKNLTGREYEIFKLKCFDNLLDKECAIILKITPQAISKTMIKIKVKIQNILDA